MLTNETIQRGLELASQATARPWERVDQRGLLILGDCGSTGMVKRKTPVCSVAPCVGSSTQDETDAAYIVEAANNYDSALREIQQLRAEIERMRPVVEAARRWYRAHYELLDMGDDKERKLAVIHNLRDICRECAIRDLETVAEAQDVE